ncbi:hypothetical protein RHGRI_001642 [Rhododendron griersonianum]|uniref:Uncharacterized protein n=1 Tax=Rhododendron griersonianum TaxID=479676 RepID=A0AAV6LM43_9ERIC|nr:hypothetical protein RHGRI_001642 [Rhododendron griersonianum]
MFDPIQKEGSDSEEDLMEVLQGIVSSTIEAQSLIQQPRPAVPLGGSTNHPVTSAVPELATAPDPDPRPAATVPESASIDQAVHDKFSGEVARSAQDHLNPKPPDIQHIKSKETVAELAVNKFCFQLAWFCVQVGLVVQFWGCCTHGVAVMAVTVSAVMAVTVTALICC